ncbi:MAG: DUF2877 domain-containing protein [Chloroflexota bacterium]
MSFYARTAGHTVPLYCFDGAVHSVFTHACNLRLGGGRLVTLLTEDQSDLPQGIRLATPAGFSFGSLGLQSGQVVKSRDGVLTFAGSALMIDLGTAQPWQVDLTQRPVDLGDPAVRRAFQEVWQQWSTCRPPEGELVVQLQGRIGELLTTLQEAAGRYDRAQAQQAAAGLIGLGAGLTPSGDDVLVGFLAGLWATAADRPGRRVFLEAFAATIVALAERTNEISRSFLWNAARGEFSSALANLVQAIAYGADSPMVEQTTAAALRVGHRSGRDSVAGLLAGLQAWPPGEEIGDGSRARSKIRVNQQ